MAPHDDIFSCFFFFFLLTFNYNQVFKHKNHLAKLTSCDLRITTSQFSFNDGLTCDTPGTYTTSLKEEPSVSSSRGLSRSHSSPNIKKQLEEEEERSRQVAPLPSVNRGSKPVPRLVHLLSSTSVGHV